MLKFTAMIILLFHLQPQYTYELFHINIMSKLHNVEEKGLLMQNHSINIEKLPKRMSGALELIIK